MKAVIFDMDGTMVDNMMVHHRAWQSKLSSLGLPLTLAEVKEQVHGINEEIIERLFGERFDEEERRRISAEKEAEYRRIFGHQLEPVEGLDQLIDTLHRHRIPMAVGTAAPPENVDFVLDNLHIRRHFDVVLHAHDVREGKPHPEIYLKAAERLDARPEECLVFEDSPTGAETARRAGCPTVIITTTHEADEFAQFPNVRKCLPDFRSIGMRELHAWFSKPQRG